MIECILPTHSVLLFDFKASSYEIFAFLGHRRVEGNIFSHNVVDQLKFIFSWPWGHAMNQFIINQTNRPKIWFIGVFLMIQDLRWHVKWGTNNRFQHSAFSILQIFSKPKVTNFTTSFAHENIGRFQIPMNDFMIIKILESTHDISQQSQSLRLCQPTFLSQVIFEITLFTVFSHDVNIVSWLINVTKLDNIFMLYFFHDLNLWLNGFEIVCVGE